MAVAGDLHGRRVRRLLRRGRRNAFLAVLLVATSAPLARCNAIKNISLGGANGIAAIIFIVTAHVHWSAVPPLAIGLFIGGMLGPAVARRTPVRVLRLVIVVARVGLAVRLGLQQY